MKKLLLIILLFTVPALADYHYASHEGSDEYPYSSWETAADSIQRAIDAAEAGDTIYVGSGLWEDGPYDLWDSLALIGVHMDSTTIDGSSIGRLECFFLNHETLIEGFTLENSRNAIEILSKAGIRIQNNRFRGNDYAIIGVLDGEISNNLFEGNNAHIFCQFGPCTVLLKNNTFVGSAVLGVQSHNGNWTIVNNLFHHNPYVSVNSLLKVYVPGDNDTAYVANNLFYRNLEDVYLQHVSTISASYRVGVVNNTIIGVGGADYPVNGIFCLSFEDSSIDLRNNTVSQVNRAIEVYDYPTTAVVRLFYNNLWENRFDCYPGDSLEFVIGNIRADPMFADTTSFRLQMYSPLIDAGDPNILDVDGTRSDIGVYGGPLGQSYLYLDLPPRIPDSLQAAVRSDSIIIHWRYNTESDFNRYQLYRDTLSGFEPTVFNMIADPDTSFYVDTEWTPDHDYYYRLVAIDNQDNISDYSDELAVLFTGVGGFDNDLVARVTTIKTNYPNPFNARTKIDYYLADVGYQPASVRLYIYNISGQLVRKLVDERQYPGEHDVVWDGLDERGESLSSGIYFARLIVSGVEIRKPRKIVLMK